MNDVSNTKICPYCGNILEIREMNFMGSKIEVPISCSCQKSSFLQSEKEKRRKKKEEKIKSYVVWSNIGKRYSNKYFSNYNLNQNNQSQVKSIQNYVGSFKEYFLKGVGIVLTGNSGVGKTHLAVAVMNELTSRGFSVAFIKASNLMTKFADLDKFASKESLDDLVNFLIEPDLLIIDDLGANKWTSFTKDYLYKVIDGRYSNMKPIFITTNVSQSELQEEFTSRISDRISGSCYMVSIKDKSYRINELKTQNT